MAATRKTTTKRKTPARRTPAKRETKATQHAKKQMWAVVLFASGILLGFLTWIEGAKAWNAVHSFLYGLFGWSVLFLAPLLIYIAVIAAMDKPLSSIKAKLWQAGVLILMISGAVQIWGEGLPDEGNLVRNIGVLYDSGTKLNGGGVFSGIFALPLLSFADTLGAKIIIFLAIFVFVMLITGSTLISLYKAVYQAIYKPVKELESVYTSRVEEREQEAPEEEQASPAPPARTRRKKAAAQKEPDLPPAAGARFDIDVDISGDAEPGGGTGTGENEMPEHPVIVPKPEETSKDKLLAAFGQDAPVEYISPDEFIFTDNPVYDVPADEAEEPRPHPLEEDIAKAEEIEEAEQIAEIVSRYIQTGGEPQWTLTEPAPAPTPELPAEQTPSPVIPSQPVEEIPLQDELILPQVYRKPPVHLLKPGKGPSSEDVTEELKGNAQRLVDTLKSFGVQTRITDICRGPAVTRYELQPSAGVKISKITGLADDIALNLASAGIRIEAPIPNKPAVGIEVPNKTISMVQIRDIIDSGEFQKEKSSVTFALGKDIAGNVKLADIAKMPHMLIAGATGSGKSVCINSIIVSLLYKASPDEVKLLMVDPKVVELGIYNGIPHLLVPVVTDPKKAAGALGWAVTEMLKRYQSFAEHSVRDITGYNKLAKTTSEIEPMPQIVIIIDELADLMMAAPNEVEDSICRLAQMARAAGMHLVIATQRPSVDVITGVIKANIPSRIAFAVSSQVDSRTILDMGGAEKLLGRGDMLYYPVGASKPIRVQGCFVSDGEVEKVVSFVKEGDSPAYDEAIAEEIERHVVTGKNERKGEGGGFDDEDEMLPQAIECVVEMGQASTSSLQRRLKLGYARAARIIDQLEQKGIVGPFEGSKPRQVLISKERWMEMKLQGVISTQLSLDNAGEPVGQAAGVSVSDTDPFGGF